MYEYRQWKGARMRNKWYSILLLGLVLVIVLLNSVIACVPASESSPTPLPAPIPEPSTTTPTPPPPRSQLPPPTRPVPASSPIAIPKEIMVSHIGFLGAGHNATELIELGVTWDRPHPGPFIWGRIEKEEGRYDWREVDSYVQDIQQYNFATLATIWPFANWDQSNWGQPGSTNIIFERKMGNGRRKPNDMNAYQRFVSALVERYDGDGEDDMQGLVFPIKYWETSNEPSMQQDIHTFFTGSAEDYLEILEATYQAVKTADPEAKVLHAGMAGMESWMVSFWEPVFEKGSQYFDIANIHSIGASEELNVPEFRKLLSKYDINKPIWVTEAQHRTGMTHDGKDVSPEEHGDILLKSYVLSFGMGVDKIFYTSFKAPPFARAEFQQSALIDSKGEKRPAYHALETLIIKMGTFMSAEEFTTGQYQFLVEGKEVYVLWGSGSIPDELTGEVLVTDIYGKEIKSTALSIILKESPIFVEKVD